jgi:hypothetical protein
LQLQEAFVYQVNYSVTERQCVALAGKVSLSQIGLESGGMGMARYKRAPFNVNKIEQPCQLLFSSFHDGLVKSEEVAVFNAN